MHVNCYVLFLFSIFSSKYRSCQLSSIHHLSPVIVLLFIAGEVYFVLNHRRMSIFSPKPCCLRCGMIMLTATFLVIAVLYHRSISLIDPYYEMGATRELSKTERFTIRVIVENTHQISDLVTFVTTHSICPAVYEIHIVWIRSKSPPMQESDFVFSKTHAHIFVEDRRELGKPYARFQSILPIETESVFLADPHMLFSCKDLIFGHSVWRSSTDSIVGTYPRIHQLESNNRVSYLSIDHVIWNSFYTFVLPDGAWIKSDYLHNYIPNQIASSERCDDLEFANYISVENGEIPSVWVKISSATRIDSISSLDQDTRSQCLTDLYNSNSPHKLSFTVSQRQAISADASYWW